MARTKRPSNPLRTKQNVLDIQDYLKYKSKRNYVIFLLGVTTGYRAGDLVKLQVRDIKQAIKYKEFVIEEGKKFNSKNVRERNRKARVVELIPSMEKILKEYIKDMKDYEYVFKSRKSTYPHIQVQAISNALKEAGEYFGLYNISAHSMRKTYAYKIYLESDKDIVAVKELLGHRSIEETKDYLGLDKEQYHKYSSKLSDFIR
ncbi:tyrosine-type recombinase/integrase [Paraclostridium bifermentans]|uniref:Tyrosine-type recombinase/integrase n=1 Tax=Paraclostridium bifermentans TaxID=1490 RepID=A0ABY8R773_PARBF|nr:tyrosine-type recombinase/integrase [Paraclostridium bifermentans]MBU5290004.1 tyrosine-type recombinase/integrase [Paraclostridium bifermentans]WGX77414.1 tyrosine-type recombinase/integrase [Paraclostridium bifermentans]